jgi:predicted AAA+ superfamily ATPase
MLAERLKEIMFDQKSVFNNRKHLLIDRNIDLDPYIKTSQVVIITGVRRCGKSSLLFLIRKQMGLDESEYCYFNFDDERILSDIAIPDQIFQLHIEIYGKTPVLFLDEIQNIPNWEKFVNRMYEQGIKVFVTGSNARLLSTEISSSLTGRNKCITLFPFSFSEYLQFIGHKYDIEKLSSGKAALLRKDFGDYFALGGFPLVVKEKDTELINAYFQDILYRDIIARFRLSQISEIRQIGHYFASNTAKQFSYSTIQQISGLKSLSSVKDYLYYFEQAYLYFYLKKFDYSVKKQLANPRKVYAIDPTFSHRLGFNFSPNTGRVLENIVFLELLRRGKEIFYHKEKRECDFVVQTGLEITEVIQVAYQVNMDNCEREYLGLEEAMKSYHVDSGLLLVDDIELNCLPLNPAIKVMKVYHWLLITC